MMLYVYNMETHTALLSLSPKKRVISQLIFLQTCSQAENNTKHPSPKRKGRLYAPREVKKNRAKEAHSPLLLTAHCYTYKGLNCQLCKNPATNVTFPLLFFQNHVFCAETYRRANPVFYPCRSQSRKPGTKQTKTIKTWGS